MTKLLRLIATWFAVLLACLSVNAPARQSRPAVQAASLPHPALWKVEDADTTIYLFGTIHLLPKGLKWFGGPVAAAFDGSDEFVSEIAGADPVKMQQIMLSTAILPAGQKLRTLLPAHERATLESALAGNGQPLDKVDVFEPWYAAIYLSTAPLLSSGYSPEDGVEALLDARAKAARRPHIGLETIEYQLGLFDSLPPEVQRKYLYQVGTLSHTIRAEIATMIDLWKRGDADKLAELMNAEEDDPEMVEALIIGRNRNWAQWIKQRLDKPGNVFIAVGAGHLAGKGSVQDQLAALGFTVTRVQ